MFWIFGTREVLWAHNLSDRRMGLSEVRGAVSPLSRTTSQAYAASDLKIYNYMTQWLYSYDRTVVLPVSQANSVRL